MGRGEKGEERGERGDSYVVLYLKKRINDGK